MPGNCNFTGSLCHSSRRDPETSSTPSAALAATWAAVHVSHQVDAARMLQADDASSSGGLGHGDGDGRCSVLHAQVNSSYYSYVGCALAPSALSVALIQSYTQQLDYCNNYVSPLRLGTILECRNHCVSTETEQLHTSSEHYLHGVYFCENPAFCLRQCLHGGAPKTGPQNGPRAPLCPPKVALNVKGFTQEFCRKINPW